MRGAYRLSKGVEGTVEASEEDEADDESASTDVASDAEPEEDAADVVPLARSRAKGKEKAVAKARATKKATVAKRKRQALPTHEEEGEFFDLSNISSDSSEPQPSSPKQRGRPRKSTSTSPSAPLAAASRRSPPRSKATKPVLPGEIDFFDLNSEDERISDALSHLSISSPGLSELENEVLEKRKESSPKRKGRPRKTYIEISD